MLSYSNTVEGLSASAFYPEDGNSMNINPCTCLELPEGSRRLRLQDMKTVGT
jgi:hypothetical protein